MSYSKRQFVEGAFEEIGLASYVYDLQPQDYQTGLRRLDAMMAEWNARGLRLGYPLPSAPQDSDIDAATDIPDAANEAVVLNLAIRLASGYGKTVAPATAALAKRALDTVTAWTAGRPIPAQLPRTMPLGAGNKPWRWSNPFVEPPVSPLEAGEDGPIEWS